MAITQQVKAELATLEVTKPELRKAEVAALLGYHLRTVQRRWQEYRDGGITALLPGRRGGARAPGQNANR